ncbi:MAG: NAD(FAD)-dependent dehydrogenase [Clostridia bacterium]|jgi:CxxC motif-containing protein|nr:NAD(FAD)-dependent dehydrogenase [Clostridia bacterium]
MDQKALVCIGCPLGCRLEVTLENSEVLRVTGQSCRKGKTYAIKECTNPTRILTTTVEVENGFLEVASIKTEKDIPKDKLFDCIKELKKVRLTAPIHIGDIVVANIADTGVNIIATTNCEALDT